jgi:serine/threonine protein kinase
LSLGGFDDALGASYRLVEVVGRGAVGEVWRAVDRRTDETVAAKLLRAEHVADRDLVARFVQERGVLTGLRDPHLVSVRDLVPVQLLPVWPSGTDTINILYPSPSIGQPSNLLTQIASGESGVRFSDACGGSLRITDSAT